MMFRRLGDTRLRPIRLHGNERRGDITMPSERSGGGVCGVEVLVGVVQTMQWPPPLAEKPGQDRCNLAGGTGRGESVAAPGGVVLHEAGRGGVQPALVAFQVGGTSKGFGEGDSASPGADV